MKLSRVRSIAISCLSIVGTLTASVVLQALFLSPVYSESQSAIGNEIADCGGDAHKFLSRMELRAVQSKKAYIEAIRELTPLSRKVIQTRCADEASNDLISRHLCYRNAVEAMGNKSGKMISEPLRAQLTRATNRMSVSIDEFTRWSAVAAACDRKIGYEICHSLRKWQATDFVPRSSIQ